MAQKKIITQYWKKNKWSRDCCLCYSQSRGLYSSNYFVSSDTIYQAHGYEGFHYDIVEVNGLKIRFDSNFGYGKSSYLRATVEKDGQRLLDFDPSKIHVLNNCSVASFDVKSYEWSSLFDKIIAASNNFNPELCSTQSIAYIEKLIEILNFYKINIRGTLVDDKEVLWDGEFLVALFVSYKTTDLLNGLKLSHITDRNTIENTLKLCRELLAKLHIIDADIADSRTMKLSDTLFLIHEFMYENDCGLDFFGSFVVERENKDGHRT